MSKGPQHVNTLARTATDSGTPEGNKRPQPDSVQGVGLGSLGSDKESYRFTHIIKNNQRRDDYARYMEYLAAMSLPNPAFNQQIGDIIDVDDWLRAKMESRLPELTEKIADLFERYSGERARRPDDLGGKPVDQFTRRGQFWPSQRLHTPQSALQG